MKSKRSRLALIGVLALALSVTVSLVSGHVADAKKKRSGKTLSATGTAGAVPQGPDSYTTNPVPFKGTATIGKKGKGQTIGNVEVTLSATGTPVAGGANGIGDLRVRLTGPNGATTGLVFGNDGRFNDGGFYGVAGNTISNLTLTDNTPTFTCAGLTAPAAPPPPPCGDPDATLNAPYTGRAQPSNGALALLKGGSVKGTYTLTAFDRCGGPACGGDSGTSSITAWSLKVTRAPTSSKK